MTYLTFKVHSKRLFSLPAVGNLYCATVWALMLFLNTICKSSAGVTNFIISTAVVCSPCLWMYACKCVQNVPAYCKASLTRRVIYSAFIYSTCTRGVSRGPRRLREGSTDVSCRLLKSSRQRRPAR